ncbi:MBL fold metallo-hydrolase [Hymenobacter sp.]|uniref:MBL fold metallo-hydrolase n=1 Tax=Hymenobacter sp. TaxID=1898978 RepID=UPI00286AE493|nr:MBL fold metallo-hydrolase [Hymenobacter sp.]
MQRVAEEVYHIPLMPRDGINCYLVEGTLVDSGIRASYGKISRCLRQVPAHRHVLTHAHADHQGSSDQLCQTFNLPLDCHEREVLRTETGLVTKDYPSPGSPIAKFQQACWAGQGHPVADTLRENDWVGTFRVVESPGHAAGHLAFFREKDGLLLAGDVATNMNLLTTWPGLHLPPAMFTSNQEQNIASLKKLADLHPRLICFGHGPVLLNDQRQFEHFAARQ